MSPFRRVVFLAAIVGVAAATVNLGFWQLRRLRTRRASNAVLRAAQAMPALRLPEELRATGAVDSGRRIVARGHFDTAGQVVLRGRVESERPGVLVVTAFLLDRVPQVLWVERGFAPSANAVTLTAPLPAPDSGTVTLSGLAFAIPVTSDSGRPLQHDGATTWQRLDRAAITARRPGSLPIYLLLQGDANGPGRLPVVAPPVITDGPHFSYAIQWFGIAIAVLTFGVLIMLRERRGSPPPRSAP